MLEVISVTLVGVVDLEGSLVIDVGTGGRDSKLAGGHEDVEGREKKKVRVPATKENEGERQRPI